MSAPDVYDMWLAHDARQQKQLEQLPECYHCGYPIQQEKAICIDDLWYCNDCLETHYTKNIEDFI